MNDSLLLLIQFILLVLLMQHKSYDWITFICVSISAGIWSTDLLKTEHMTPSALTHTE